MEPAGVKDEVLLKKAPGLGPFVWLLLIRLGAVAGSSGFPLPASIGSTGLTVSSPLGMLAAFKFEVVDMLVAKFIGG